MLDTQAERSAVAATGAIALLEALDGVMDEALIAPVERTIRERKPDDVDRRIPPPRVVREHIEEFR